VARQRHSVLALCEVWLVQWRWLVRLLLLGMLLGSTTAQAQTLPLPLTQSAVFAGAERLYRERIAELATRHDLDRDSRFNHRVQRIAADLLQQAKKDYPQAAGWAWELHTSHDDAESASSMAGGKLLVGAGYASKLQLNDAELAMLLAHEMQHALQEHNYQEFEAALRLAPQWQSRPFSELEEAVFNDAALMKLLESLNFQQEIEADREGLLLAWRAGWPAPALANYFKKFRRSHPTPNFDSVTHPSPSSRWAAARALAETLGPPR